MSRVTILAHQIARNQLLDRLQALGAVEVEAIAAEGPVVPPKDNPYLDQAAHLEHQISRTDFVINFLSEYRPKLGMVASFMRQRTQTDLDGFLNADKKIDFERVYARTERIKESKLKLAGEIGRMRARLEVLEPWLSLDVSGSDVSQISVQLRLGSVKEGALDGLSAAVADRCIDLTVVARDQGEARIAVLVYGEDKGAEGQVLSDAGFLPVDLELDHRSVDQLLGEIKKAVVELGDEVDELDAEAGELSSLLPELRVLRDFLSTKARREAVQAEFLETRDSFMIEGWIETSRVPELSSDLQSLDVVDFDFSEAGPEDNPPIVLENRRLVRPFEVLTRLYGVPNYREQDPTPIMAVFFFLFFGFALGDFGYGLILVLACQILKRILPVTSVGRDWFNLFSLGEWPRCWSAYRQAAILA